jgi:hypothetical protein
MMRQFISRFMENFIQNLANGWIVVYTYMGKCAVTFNQGGKKYKAHETVSLRVPFLLQNLTT